MFSIIGILLVFGAIVGGYLMEHGKLAVLLQPAELLIIGGAAAGTILIANPVPTLVRIGKGMGAAFGSSRYTKAFYVENIRMLNELFQIARKGGLMKLEADVETPDKSAVFKKYPAFLKDHHALYFVCDTLRMSIAGGVAPFDLDQVMEADLTVHHEETAAPVSALQAVADSLPGLGIVAAVLGVVITMGALGGPPEEIGNKVAAALVGTFLGILLCYGLFGPLASKMATVNNEEAQYYRFLRTAITSFVKGFAPILSVESARRTIPAQARPSFQEMEKACKGAKLGAAGQGDKPPEDKPGDKK